jgi:hypothetical protein
VRILEDRSDWLGLLGQNLRREVLELGQRPQLGYTYWIVEREAYKQLESVLQRSNLMSCMALLIVLQVLTPVQLIVN